MSFDKHACLGLPQRRVGLNLREAVSKAMLVSKLRHELQTPRRSGERSSRTPIEATSSHRT